MMGIGANHSAFVFQASSSLDPQWINHNYRSTLAGESSSLIHSWQHNILKPSIVLTSTDPYKPLICLGLLEELQPEIHLHLNY